MSLRYLSEHAEMLFHTVTAIEAETVVIGLLNAGNPSLTP